MEIVRKVERREWDEVTLTVGEFVWFGLLYTEKVHPTFNFDNDSVCASEVWRFKDDNRVYITNYDDGVVSFSGAEGQYIKYSNGNKRCLGGLVSVSFTVEEDMREVLNKLKESNNE
jgi:hypothetical protein